MSHRVLIYYALLQLRESLGVCGADVSSATQRGSAAVRSLRPLPGQNGRGGSSGGLGSASASDTGTYR